MADPVAVPGPDPAAGPGVDPGERRRALATCLWLAAAVLLGGFDLPARGYEAFQFAPFGFVAGLLALLYVFVLVQSGIVRRGRSWLAPLLLVYWTAATGMAFRVLLPGPGLVQVALVIGAAIAAAILASRKDREEAMLWLGIVAVVLAVLRFGLVPFFEARSGLPDWGPIRLGQAANAFRDVFVAYAPEQPAAQVLHFAAMACYALALKTQWGATGAAPPSG
ncbi:MAG TPA: hypothetical protein VFG78_06465 [Gemmatimonadota bacterium]|nr:hypothetical protein [Gemmatimonadota bacterium]